MADADEKVSTKLPPEKPAATRTRRFVVLSFWVVIACLGLPHWIWTTSIHRSTLPSEVIDSWANGEVSVTVAYQWIVLINCSRRVRYAIL